MKILKKENWWIWLLLLIGTQGVSNIILGALTDVFKKEEWYGKLKNWLKYIVPIALIILLILFAGISLVDKSDVINVKFDYTLTVLSSIILIPLALFYAFGIVFTIFIVQIMAKTAAALDVPGKEIYLSPYVWVLLIIIPLIGWILLVVMLIYINIWPIVMLYKGAGEKYVK